MAMNTDMQLFQAAAIVCEHVARMKMPILHAEKSEPDDDSDSGWQFLCGAEKEDWHKAQVWALHEVLAEDSSLIAFMGKPPGTVLTRSNPNQPWQVSLKRL